MRILAFATLVSLLLVPTYAGTLRLGAPVVSNNQYRFPVILQGDADGVAALDFRLSYDPAVFSPVSAQSGPSAASAQKQVSSNVAAPGEFVVVMMGFNQNAVGAGNVIEIVMEKVADPSAGHSVLRIDEPTLATADGSAIRSRGLARTVEFDQNKGEDGDSDFSDEPDSAEPDTDAPSEPAPNTESDPAQPAAPRTGSGSVPFVIAGRGDGNTISGRMPVTGGALPGSGGRTEVPPTGQGAPENAAQAPALPPNASTTGAAVNTVAARETAGPDDIAASSDPVVPMPAGVAQSAKLATTADEATAETAPETGDTKEGDGSSRSVLGLLLLLGLAPAAAFVVYKVLLR